LKNAPLKTKDETHLSPSKKGSFAAERGKDGLNMLDRKPAARPPVMPLTMMFAADRIGVPYGRYAMDHNVLVDAQLRVAEEFGFDHVSVISDPAREAADCGAEVRFFDDQPPAIDEARTLFQDKAVLASIRIPDPLGGGRMTDRINGVSLLREKAGADLAVEGWVEGPCAEAADLRGINTLMMDFFDDEDFVRDLFAFTTNLAISFACAQIDAGADLIGIGDAACSLVGPAIYEDFVLAEEKRLIEAIHARGARTRLHICGNTAALCGMIRSLDIGMMDLDYMVDIATARADLGPDIAILGNIDPVSILRNGTPDKIEKELADCRAAAGERYIVGAGCEIPRDTPHENVRALGRFAGSLV
jgi:MtaA/CmuA family methyltransferase